MTTSPAPAGGAALRAHADPPALPPATIVIPALDEEAVIAHSVRSALAQDYAGDVHVVVVDDGSSDHTARTAAALGATVVRQANAGPAAARNAGVLCSDDDIVVFTDADCVLAPDFVDRIVAPLVAGEADVTMGAYQTTSPTMISRLCQLEFEERYRRLRHARPLDFAATYAMAMHRSVLVDADGFDQVSFRAADHEDVDLAWRLAARGARFAFVEDAIVYHDHATSLADYFRTKIQRGFWRTHTVRRHPDKILHDSYTPAMLRFQIVLAGALPILAVAALRWRLARLALAAGATAGTASTAPLMVTALRHDPAMAPVVPLFAAGRAVALMSGVVRGLADAAWSSPRRSQP